MSLATPSPISQDVRCCLGCGYSLRGLLSNRCPECGRPFEPGGTLPAWVQNVCNPVHWPAKYARRGMLLLLAAELILLPPFALTLFVWIIISLPIVYGCYMHSLEVRAVVRKFGINRSTLPDERSIRWSTRRWLAAGLVLTILHAPQLAIVAIELPWLNHEAQRVYEREPLLGPHRLRWCMVPITWHLDVEPNGVYFNLGSWLMAYDPGGTHPQHFHLCGDWSYSDGPDLW